MVPNCDLDLHFKKFIYFKFLVALGLCCFVQAFSSCCKWGAALVMALGLLVAVASLVVKHGSRAFRLQ